jgi:hypothetical protein
MFSAQGPAQDPISIVALVVALAIVLIVWWRQALIVLAIALVALLGLGAIEVLHDLHL